LVELKIMLGMMRWHIAYAQNHITRRFSPQGLARFFPGERWQRKKTNARIEDILFLSVAPKRKAPNQ
jgi:hypothetical protein